MIQGFPIKDFVTTSFVRLRHLGGRYKGSAATLGLLRSEPEIKPRKRSKHKNDYSKNEPSEHGNLLWATSRQYRQQSQIGALTSPQGPIRPVAPP